MSEFYVYAHRRVTDGRIFYIGKGKGDRLRRAYGRNTYWQRVAAKHGWVAEKLFTGLGEHCAHSIEKMLIASLKPNLTNVTNGGEGVSGLRHTPETKRKMVENRKPGWIPFWTGKVMPDEMKEKFRAAKLGKPQSPEHAAKSRMAKVGKPQTPSAREFTRKLKSIPIRCSDGREFPSATVAARAISAELGVNASQGNISMCARGTRKIAYGLTWEYIE